MGTLLHAVAHGLVADDTIMLANLQGGDGLAENTVYYVLASGLTADDFAVALTSGGTAITYDTDITAGTVMRTDTYEVIADGISDGPDTVTLAAPDAPTLTSTLVSNIVRLFIELPSYTDIAVRLRATETQVTHAYVTGVPQWDQSLNITMPLGTTTMSIPALGNTAYSCRSRVQDVYGNFSDWSLVTALTTDPGDDSISVVDGAITTTKIADDSITTAKMKAHSITADLLAATIVLASLIKTADSGRRIEVDSFGIRLYDSSEELLVNIPTNGDPVYVKGQVNASSFISQTAATLYGANTLPGSSVTTLQNGISAPTNAPSVVASVDYLGLTSTPSNLGSAGGIAYDSGAGTYWVACDPSVSPYYVAQEFNATTGALVRSISRTGSTTTTTTTLGSTSHVSDTADGIVGTVDTHITSPLTMPRDGTVTKVAVYMAGRLGTCDTRVGIWNSSGTLLRESATFTAASGGSTGVGNSDLHNVALSSGYAASSGQVLYAGFRRMNGTDGSQHDKDDGSGKSTYSGDGTSGNATSWGVRNSASKINVYITYTYTVSTVLETLPCVGIATDGSYIYTLDSSGVVWKYDRTTLAHVTHAAVTLSGTASKAGMFYDATAAALVVTTTTGTGAGVYPKFILVSPSTLAATGTAYSAAAGTTFSGTTDTFRGGARLADPLNASAATYWVATTSAVYAYTFSGSVATQTANRNFGQSSTVGDGLTHDGTQFRGWDSAAPTKVWKFSAWDFTTLSTTLWIGYAWYDSAGTTHETAMSPRTSLTIRRRERVQVNNAAIPTGGADDPNNVRVYMLQNATDTGAGTFWLQVTDALTSRFVLTYTGSGTHDGAGTAFPAGTPADLTDAGGHWHLKGDGSVLFDTTVTPGGKPATSQVFSGHGTFTYTRPAGLAYAIVEVVGAGAAGGGASAAASGGHSKGGGGGAGGYSRSILSAATIGASQTVTVGTGGTGVSGGTGNSGGDSSFGALVIGKGGSGGTVNGTTSTSVYVVPGGAGGVAGTGDIAAPGAYGGFGVGGTSLAGGGMGAATQYGEGGKGAATGSAAQSVVGGAASGNGAGGGGAASTSTGAANVGGAGTDGIVIVTEFYGA